MPSSQKDTWISCQTLFSMFQIKIDDVSYMAFASAVPLEWANEVRVTEDVYLNRIDFIDTYTDNVLEFVVV